MQSRRPLVVVALCLLFPALSAATAATAGGSVIVMYTALDGCRTSRHRPIDDPQFNVTIWGKTEIKTKPTALHRFEDGSAVLYTVHMTFIEKLQRRCASNVDDGVDTVSMAGGDGGGGRRCDATAIRQFEEEVAPCLLEQLKENFEFEYLWNEVFSSRFGNLYSLDMGMKLRYQMIGVFCMNKPNYISCQWRICHGI